jgi:hypothetical protein
MFTFIASAAAIGSVPALTVVGAFLLDVVPVTTRDGRRLRGVDSGPSAPRGSTAAPAQCSFGPAVCSHFQCGSFRTQGEVLFGDRAPRVGEGAVRHDVGALVVGMGVQRITTS